MDLNTFLMSKDSIYIYGASTPSYGEVLYGPKKKCPVCKGLRPSRAFVNDVCHKCSKVGELEQHEETYLDEG